MNRRIIRRLVLSLVLVSAVLVCSEAKAWWRWGGCWGHWGYHTAWVGHGYWGGGYSCYTPHYPACYTPYYTTCYTPCYTPIYSCYRPWWGCYRGWRCWRPCNVCCCTTMHCGCSCCHGVILDSTPVEVQMTPTEAQDPPPTTAPKMAPGDAAPMKTTSLGPQSAVLNVHVPSNARVTINGLPTRSTGALRRYVSQDLATGFRYTYDVRAEADVNGRTVAQTKTVQMRAGAAADLAFDFTQPATPETSLTLNVPSDARVFLAGNEMKGTGSVRTFRTKRLPAGKTWSGYTVRVVVDQNGTDVQQEEMISLTAGEQREMTFDFSVDKIASAR